MKKIIYIFASVLLLSSCKKFLETQPQLQVDQDQAIINAGTAATAANGLFNLLASGNYYGSNFPALSYLSAGDIQWSGSQSDPNEITKHLTSATNGYVQSAWTAIYKTISQANHIIDKVPGVSDPLLTTALKNQYLGEAYFVRALAYFDLARGWGGVQLVLKPTNATSDNSDIPRSSLADTYAQVLKDLNAAESLVPTALNRNRVSLRTVQALKARFYLYQKNWALAEQFASNVIGDNSNYSLVAPYSAFFANNAVNTSESVFELAYTTSNTNGHSNWWLPPALGGRREWSPNDALVTLLNNPAIGGNRSALIAQTAAPGNLWYGRLYYRTPLGTDPAYVIRISELYLIRAEARANQGNLTGTNSAISDLNTVRARAAVAASMATTQADILLAIEKERQVEFPFEADRWFNLVRTDRAQTLLGLPDKHLYLFPIPYNETLVDPQLAGSNRNPGY
ncbi:RagB/SusD family nutrient uptake outer membrane protein [Pedobacter rhodius]|uniref:RagB/SusD family nutrient uptake outer membrane protein n=1 Tax=Pedobacter rhodius TaxID=3004098 RepID=A0ABT4L180_9SPHI|nr:RagB/SusD family nutrient uptake outer membrane protein [Pedobacter sp. SJ11]MCZ4224932.1 RagB/SusD family nutrient uptake outer membrane protein [Pedobacter sp. SJ11]